MGSSFAIELVAALSAVFGGAYWLGLRRMRSPESGFGLQFAIVVGACAAFVAMVALPWIAVGLINLRFGNCLLIAAWYVWVPSALFVGGWVALTVSKSGSKNRGESTALLAVCAAGSVSLFFGFGCYIAMDGRVVYVSNPSSGVYFRGFRISDIESIYRIGDVEGRGGRQKWRTVDDLMFVDGKGQGWTTYWFSNAANLRARQKAGERVSESLGVIPIEIGVVSQSQLKRLESR